MTKTIAEAVVVDGDTQTVQVESGRYAFAVGGVFDGASVSLHTHVGVARDIPVFAEAYTSASVDVVWMPACTVYLKVANAGANTNVNAAISPINHDLE